MIFLILETIAVSFLILTYLMLNIL